MLKNTLIVCVLACFVCGVSIAEESKQIGDINSGSQAGEVHNLNLYDETGIMIRPGSEAAGPLSLKRTCVICHDYGTIVDGWHFNQSPMMLAEDGQIIQGDPGRNGEPWIMTVSPTASRVPSKSSASSLPTNTTRRRFSTSRLLMKRPPTAGIMLRMVP